MTLLNIYKSVNSSALTQDRLQCFTTYSDTKNVRKTISRNPFLIGTKTLKEEVKNKISGTSTSLFISLWIKIKMAPNARQIEMEIPRGGRFYSLRSAGRGSTNTHYFTSSNSLASNWRWKSLTYQFHSLFCMQSLIFLPFSTEFFIINARCSLPPFSSLKRKANEGGCFSWNENNKSRGR